jgi:hypothetical protein
MDVDDFVDEGNSACASCERRWSPKSLGVLQPCCQQSVRYDAFARLKVLLVHYLYDNKVADIKNGYAEMSGQLNCSYPKDTSNQD